MQKMPAKRLMLSLRMITEELDDLDWSYEAAGEQDEMRWCGISLWNGALRGDVLYLISADQADSFPTDRYAYLSTENLHGKAPHICCTGKSELELYNAAVCIFQKYRDYETRLNDIIINRGSLDDLCRASHDFFRNPMYIHDNAFAILAAPVWVEGMLRFKFNQNTGRYYIPINVIEEFKYSSDYIRTLQMTKAGIWGLDQFPNSMRSLYFNIRDGQYYRARILVNELQTPLRQSQLQLIEYLGDCINAILRRDEQTANFHQRDFEEMFIDLISGKAVDDSDLSVLLTALGWRTGDEYMCVAVQRQARSVVANAASLRSILTSAFSSVFGFVRNEQLCLVINLTASGIDMNDVHPKIAQIVRDCYLFGGSSNQFFGFSHLQDAYKQANMALQKAFSQQTSSWFIAFADCALDYLLNSIRSAMPARMIVSPALPLLQRYDRSKNTDYYQTLRAYLQSGQNISRAAESLYIHRTTLLYRMEKINGLIRMNLDDPGVRLYLLFSYAIWDQEQAEHGDEKAASKR